MRKKTETLTRATAGTSTSKPAAPVVVNAVNRSQAGNCACEGDVQVCAYLKWEAAGKPEGDGMQFWLEAEKELLQAK